MGVTVGSRPPSRRHAASNRTLDQKGTIRHTLQIAGKVLLDRREVENYKPKPTGRPRK